MNFSRSPSNESENIEYYPSTDAETALTNALMLGRILRRTAFGRPELPQASGTAVDSPLMREASQRSQMLGGLSTNEALARFLMANEDYSDKLNADTAKDAAAATAAGAAGAGGAYGVHRLWQSLGGSLANAGAPLIGGALKRAIPGYMAYEAGKAMLSSPKGPAGMLAPFVPKTGRGLTPDEMALADYLSRAKPGMEHK